MTCEQWIPLLSQLLDGEAQDLPGGQFENHLESCDECRDQLDSFRQLSGILSTHTEADPHFLTRFRARRNMELGVPGIWRVWRKLAVRLLPLATAAILGAAAVVWLSVEEEGLVELEAIELGNGYSMLYEDVTEVEPVLHIALEPFPAEGEIP